MPQIADIVVKKYDGTTNITYTALTPSSGDGTPAVWRSESAGTQANLKPALSLSSRWNGPRTARRVDASFMYPQQYTDTTTGLVLVKNKVIMNLSAVVPAEVPDTVLQEAVAQATNLFASTLFRSSVQAGFAPT